MNGRKKKKISVSQIILAALLLLLGLICVYPMWYTFIVSFSDKAKVTAGKVLFVPRGLTFTAYEKLLSDGSFFRAFLVSVERCVLGVGLNMVLMALTAYPLAMPAARFPERRVYVWYLMFNMLFSGGTIGWYLNIKYLHLLDSIWALVLPMGLPIYNAVLLMNFFKNVPIDMNESATVDGVSPLTILVRIYLPVSLPALATVGLFCFVSHWNSWYDGLVLINKSTLMPLQTLIYQLNVRIDTDNMTSEQLREMAKMSSETLNAAKVIIALAPLMCIYPFLQKYFVSGLTLGAVKE